MAGAARVFCLMRAWDVIILCFVEYMNGIGEGEMGCDEVGCEGGCVGCVWGCVWWGLCVGRGVMCGGVYEEKCVGMCEGVDGVCMMFGVCVSLCVCVFGWGLCVCRGGQV